ncbi:MAG: YCF48-related protein [Saprospiraceae bacterium]
MSFKNIIGTLTFLSFINLGFAQISEIGDKELNFNLNGQNLRMTYFGNKDISVANNHVKLAVIHIHGINRNGRDYFDVISQAADYANLYENNVFLAPQFVTQDDKIALNLSNDYLYWDVDYDRGTNALNIPENISTFGVLDSMVNQLVSSYPNLCQIIISGHSRGGQLTQRYAGSNVVDNSINIPIRYVSAGSSSYFYLDNERRITGTEDQFQVPNTTCNYYNDWKYGLENLASYPYISAVGAATIRNQYKDRAIYYLVGADDNSPTDPNLATDCAAMLQGSHRVERFDIFRNYLEQYYTNNYNFDINQNHKWATVSGVGHSNRSVFTSTTGLNTEFNLNIDDTKLKLGWQIKNSGLTSELLRDVQFIDVNHGWIVGDNGTIYRTLDGGSTWLTPSIIPTSSDIRGVYFINNMTGWAVRSSGRVLKTTDGGDTWHISNTITSNTLYSIYFYDANIGWAVGNNGTIIKTTDGGNNWTTQTSGVTDRLWRVHFINNQIGWVVGQNGAAVRTIDGGITWNIMPTNTSNDLRGIHFNDVNIGWIAGHDGTILYTSDGGNNWQTQYTTTTFNLRDIQMIGNNGFAVGSDGRIIHTYNGGKNWIRQDNSLATDDLWSVAMIDAHNIWIVGENGLIQQTQRGGQRCLLNTSFGLADTIEVNGTETFTLTADKNCYSSYEFSWNTGDNSSEIMVFASSLSAGYSTYEVIVSDGFNCYDTATVVFSKMVLPVELLSFEAKATDNKQVELVWTTASELNNDYFVIERSKNASDWENIGRVLGIGNSIELKDYDFTDFSPYLGINYYRLKQVDLDGTTDFSDIRNVIIEQDYQIKVFPNPTNHQLFISMKTEKFVQDFRILNIEMYNTLGRKVLETNYSNVSSDLIELDISNLRSGIYYLSIRIDDSIIEDKLVHIINEK